MTDTTKQWVLRSRIQRAFQNNDKNLETHLLEEYSASYGLLSGRPDDPPCQYFGCTDDCTSPDGGEMFHCDKHTNKILEGL